MGTNLDFVGPPEAFELPQPHVLRLHPPLPAGRTLLRAFPCQHHDRPAGKPEEGNHTQNAFTFHMSTLRLDSAGRLDCREKKLLLKLNANSNLKLKIHSEVFYKQNAKLDRKIHIAFISSCRLTLAQRSTEVKAVVYIRDRHEIRMTNSNTKSRVTQDSNRPDNNHTLLFR